MVEKNNIVKKTIPTKKSLVKMPHLIIPVNTLDERATKIFFENQKKIAKTFSENQKIIFEYLIGFNRRMISIRKDMRKIIEEEVTKQFDAKKIMLEGLYKDVLLQKACLFDKKLISREDLTAKYKELKGKQNG